MTQPQPPKSTNNRRTEIESPSFVKRGRLWMPETAQQRSLLQKLWNWTGFKEKKLWDVLQLLVVPTALAIGAFYLQETAKQRDLQIIEANRQKDQQIADDRTKQETLNRYFDQISALLFERKLRTAGERDEVRIMARVRTFAVLRELDSRRNAQLIDFLREAGLVAKANPIISLEGADLAEMQSIRVNFEGVNLRRANLRRANFAGTNFIEADLSMASLKLANLNGADLRKANLTLASLKSAGLGGADLRLANLNGADLREAKLDEANLTAANLNAANLDAGTLKTAYLCKTTMPDGTQSDRDCDKLKQLK